MKSLKIYFAYISGKEEWVSYALTEEEATKLASDSFWLEELKGEITVKKETKQVFELYETFEFKENATNHISYTCPACRVTSSEDIYKPESKELLVCCGNIKKHSDKKEVWIHVLDKKERRE